jgi:3-hydroxy-5-methyl-1-naphthoate 3-O-methyltransferase
LQFGLPDEPDDQLLRGAVTVAADQTKIIPLLVEHPEGLSPDEVAEALILNPRLTEMVLRALHHLGLLEVNDGRYRAGEVAARHLDPNKPPYFGWYMSFVHAGCWERMGQLGDYLTGTLPLPDTVYEPSDELGRMLLAGMHPLSTAVANVFLERVDLSGCRRLLDVGAGTAAFTIAVLNAVPQARAVVTDQAYLVDITRSYIDKAGLADRVEVKAADLFADALPAGFDTVFVNNVFTRGTLSVERWGWPNISSRWSLAAPSTSVNT